MKERERERKGEANLREQDWRSKGPAKRPCSLLQVIPLELMVAAMFPPLTNLSAKAQCFGLSVSVSFFGCGNGIPGVDLQKRPTLITFFISSNHFLFLPNPSHYLCHRVTKSVYDVVLGEERFHMWMWASVRPIGLGRLMKLYYGPRLAHYCQEIIFPPSHGRL